MARIGELPAPRRPDPTPGGPAFDTYPRSPASVPRARRDVRDQLLRHRVPKDVRDATTLLVSELVTNAVLRTEAAAITCAVRVLRDRVRVEVRAGGIGHGAPAVRGFTGATAGHRGGAPAVGGGMLLVDLVAASWGVIPDPEGEGRTTWATLSLLPEASDPPPPEVSDPPAPFGQVTRW